MNGGNHRNFLPFLNLRHPQCNMHQGWSGVPRILLAGWQVHFNEILRWPRPVVGSIDRQLTPRFGEIEVHLVSILQGHFPPTVFRII